jgi:hypothetical protein
MTENATGQCNFQDSRIYLWVITDHLLDCSSFPKHLSDFLVEFLVVLYIRMRLDEVRSLQLLPHPFRIEI